MSSYPGNNQPHISSPERQKLWTRWGHLKQERASWWSQWQELSTFYLPYNGRFFVQDRNRGWRKWNAQYDSTAMRAVRVLSAGIMSGATSPARPWFRLATPDPELNRYHAVKVWLDEVTQLIQRVFQKSNTYRALHQIYEELAVFGTASTICLPDYRSVIHHYPLACGEYAIATDYQGRVCTLYREFERPVAEIVKEFGYDNCSLTVRNLYDRGSLDQWIRIVHAIEPRADRDTRKANNKNMAWSSVYFELGAERDKYLRESGFSEFPALVPRWAVAGGDIYGNSPGMQALGDVKQLQHEQLRKAQGIDYKVRPPVQVPTALKNREIDTLPGGVTYYDPASPQAGIRPLWEVPLDMSHLLQDIEDVRQRIRGSFFTDLFLMLADADAGRMTATEVAMRSEEKMTQLGPIMERLHNELLEPLVELAFTNLLRANALPPPPPEMGGMELSVEFVSMIAQAQKAIQTNAIDRYIGNLGAIAQYKPEILDKFDADQWADIYADALGVSPDLIIPSDKAALVRQQRAQAAQQQMAAEQALQQTQAVKNLAQAPTSGDTALSGIMQNLTGYT